MTSHKSNAFYIFAAIVVIMAVFSVLSILNAKNPYQNMPPDSTAECGNLDDVSNIQHLSHHPQQYKDCIKQVKPQKFLEATGQNLNDFLGRIG